MTSSRNDPPSEPDVEAPTKPPLSDEDEDEIEDDQLDEAHYDSLEKTSTPPGDYWALPYFKQAVRGFLVHNCITPLTTVVLLNDKESWPVNELHHSNSYLL